MCFCISVSLNGPGKSIHRLLFAFILLLISENYFYYRTLYVFVQAKVLSPETTRWSVSHPTHHRDQAAGSPTFCLSPGPRTRAACWQTSGSSLRPTVSCLIGSFVFTPYIKQGWTRPWCRMSIRRGFISCLTLGIRVRMHILSTGTCTCTELDRASELEVAENAPTVLYLYLLYLTN